VYFRRLSASDWYFLSKKITLKATPKAEQCPIITLKATPKAKQCPIIKLKATPKA